eukprot:Hpha_TRINITY_DN16453_c1_g2::TRINITY_DN16453_c1_g2_i4::g.161220::m.161220
MDMLKGWASERKVVDNRSAAETCEKEDKLIQEGKMNPEDRTTGMAADAEVKVARVRRVITHFPPCLLVHIVRNKHGVRDSRNVEVPLRMRWAQRLYELVYVCVHHGWGVSSGHYVAFTKYKGAWWMMSDAEREDLSKRANPEGIVIAAALRATLLCYRAAPLPATPPPTSPPDAKKQKKASKPSPKPSPKRSKGPAQSSSQASKASASQKVRSRKSGAKGEEG